jgi:hypothetical protein
VVAHDEAGIVVFLDRPGRREAANLVNRTSRVGDPQLKCSRGFENSPASAALSNMDLIIAFVVTFALGFGAGYAVRERKSRMRRRSYYQRDSLD